MKRLPAFLLLLAHISTTLPAATLQNTLHMAHPRAMPRSEIMADGRILVLGGSDSAGPVNSVEIYDPEKKVWIEGVPMGEPRHLFTLTRLRNGTYLVTGGFNGSRASASVEAFDPSIPKWTAKTPMREGRYSHTATLLPDGRVLIAGGSDDLRGKGTAEIYDPKADSWSPAGTMSITDRLWHTATLIGGDRVLVVGSPTSPVCEVYNVTNNTWSVVGSLAEVRSRHSAVMLKGGNVMVVGGMDQLTSTSRVSAEVFDPLKGTWSSAGALSVPRHFATALGDGNGHIFVIGGHNEGHGAVESVEMFSIGTGKWETVAGLSLRADGGTGLLLPSGSLFIAGGSIASGFSSSARLLVLPAPPNDADYDGLSFFEEIVMGYDPFDEDTGGTGISDASKDWDNDGFSNLYEIKMASRSATMTAPPGKSVTPPKSGK